MPPGGLLFCDLLGQRILSIQLDPDQSYVPGKETTVVAHHSHNQFEPSELRMKTLKHNDVKATLLLQGVVFEDNSTWSAQKE
jgi:hypothetical protein